MSAKLKNFLIVLVKHDRMTRHKTTDHNEVLPFGVPTEIMERSLESIDLVNLPILIVEYVKPIFAIIRFACWIVVSLKLHQELI